MLGSMLEDLGLSSDELVPELIAKGRIPADATCNGSPFDPEEEAEEHMMFVAGLTQAARLIDSRTGGGAAAPSGHPHVEARGGKQTDLPREAHEACEALGVAQHAAIATVLKRIDAALHHTRKGGFSQGIGGAKGGNSAKGSGSGDRDAIDEFAFKRIASTIAADFKVRRLMLLTRLDVTIQSFMWSERCQDREAEVAAALRPLRSALQDDPPSFTRADCEQIPKSMIDALSDTPRTSGKSSAKRIVYTSKPPDRCVV